MRMFGQAIGNTQYRLLIKAYVHCMCAFPISKMGRIQQSLHISTPTNMGLYDKYAVSLIV